MHRVERDGAGQVLDRRTAAARDAVASARDAVASARDAVAAAAQRYVDALQLAAGALEALPALDADTFATASQPLGQLWLPGATGVDYVVAVPDAGIAAASWRDRADADRGPATPCTTSPCCPAWLRTLLQDGASPGAVAVMRDITDRHASEELPLDALGPAEREA